MIKKIMILALALGVCSTAVAEIVVKSEGKTKNGQRYVQYRKGNIIAYKYGLINSEYVAAMATKCAPKMTPEQAKRTYKKLKKEYKAQGRKVVSKKAAVSKKGYMPLPPSDMKMENGMGTESAQKTLIKMVRDVCLECGCQPEE